MNTRHITKALCISVLFIAAALAFVSSVWADNLAPGGSGAGVGDLFPIAPGEILLTFNNEVWGSTAFGGTVGTDVIKDPSNPFCAGCLDFEFLVFNNSSGPISISQVADTSFTGFNTDVGVQSSGLGGLPCTTNPPVFGSSGVSRSADGSTVAYSYSSGVPQGGCTIDMQIDTNATSFTAGALNITGSSGVVAGIPTFAPASTTPTPTPEPSTLLLLGSGLLGMAGLKLKWNRLV